MKKTLLTLLAASCSLTLPVSAQLKPGDGIRLGQTTLLVPELSAAYHWNDNVNLRRRAVDEGGFTLEENEEDAFLRTQASLSLNYWNRSTRIQSKAWYDYQDYDTFNNLDKPSYGVNIGYFWARPQAKTTVRIDYSYQVAVDRTERSEDFVGDSLQTSELEDVAERVERTENRFGVSVDQRLIPKVRLELNYTYADFAYDAERYNDRQSHTGYGELSYQWTERSKPYLRAGMGLDDDEGFVDTAEKPFYMLGIRRQMTEKIAVDLAVGYESYTRTPAEGVDEGIELKDSGLKWTANINYALTHKTRVNISGRTGYSSVASPGSSSRDEIAASISLDHQTTNQLSQRISFAWREDDYISLFPARGDLFDELKETQYLVYRIDYQTVRPWLSVFGQASYEDGSSRIPGDSYTETEFSIGAKARY